jgi:hypothetical protein
MFTQRSRRNRRRLGLVSTLVNGSNIIGSTPITAHGTAQRSPTIVIRPVTPIIVGSQKTVTASNPNLTPSGQSANAAPAGGVSDATLWEWYQFGYALDSSQTNRLIQGGYLNSSGRANTGGGAGSGAWAGNPGGWGNGSQYTPGYANPLPTSQNNLAQLTLQYQNNPASLTAAQWSQLQAAGVIPSTVPYSDASLINPASSATSAASASGAIDPATGVPYATELAEEESGTTTTSTSSIGDLLDADYGGLPLFAWILIGGGTLWVLTSMGGKRR